MPRPTIAAYGAVDRFNYGDLLFPLILQRAFERAEAEIEFVTVGMRAADLSQYGALPSFNLSWLRTPANLPSGSSVVIAGGEVLGAGWSRLLSHLLPTSIGDSVYGAVSRFVSEQRLDRIGQKFAHCPWPIPFAPRPKHFHNEVKVLFNAVGGSGLANRSQEWRDEVKASIAEAAFASVRDQATLDSLGGETSSAQLHADSAGALADLFPASSLPAMASPAVREILDGVPFACFQLHRYFTDDKLKRFAAGLDEWGDATGNRVVLLPIGRATGHSDQIALRKVRAAMRCDADLLEDAGVFDLMALLAHCAVYAGSSLHGLITSMGYGRPYATIGKTPKCAAFLETWCPEEMHAPARAKGLAETLSERATIAPSALAESIRSLRASALAGLDSLVASALSS